MFASFGWKFEYCTFPGTSQKLRKIHDLGDLAENLSRTFFCNLQWKQYFLKTLKHMNIILLLGFSNMYLSNQYFQKKDCKRTMLEKPHSKGNTKGHKNSFQNSHKNINFWLSLLRALPCLVKETMLPYILTALTASWLSAVIHLLTRACTFVCSQPDFKCYLLLVSIELYVTMFIQHVIITSR